MEMSGFFPIWRPAAATDSVSQSLSLSHLVGVSGRRKFDLFSSIFNVNATSSWPERTSAMSNQQRQQQQQHVVAPDCWKWTLWLELFWGFPIKIWCARCRCLVSPASAAPQTQSQAQHQLRDIQPFCSFPRYAGAAHSHTLAAYLNKFICNLVFAVCEHFPHFEWPEKGARMSWRWGAGRGCRFVCLSHR